jgi:hypothetical protein
VTSLDRALAYIGRGWNPVPIPYRSKNPGVDGWQHRIIDAETAPRYFNGGRINIGVQMGAHSNGLNDVDLDCREAVEIAPHLLPKTDAIFGRPTKRTSHYLYYTALHDLLGKGAIRLKDPVDKATLVELRIGGGEKGAQTVFPGSTHEETGDPIEWEINGEPATVDGDNLKRQVYRIAALSLLAKYWPKKDGGRHDQGLIVGGFLARCGFTREKAAALMGAIAKVAGDEEAYDRAQCASDAVDGFRRGNANIYGLPQLIDAYGEKVGKKVAEWLEYGTATVDGGQAENDASQSDDDPDPGPGATETLTHVDADKVEMRAIEWLWPDRFALGKIGLLVGLPDEGKGQILCDMAARVSTGDAWPLKEGTAPQGNIILLTAEDALDDTVIPRLESAGADRSKVKIVQMVRKRGSTDRMFSLVTDLELLRKKVAEIGNVILILIDPISAYLGVGKIDSFRTTDVRAVMAPLVDLASELGAAIIGVMHFNKKVDVTNALLRISDSLAFGAVARHVWAAIDDSDNQRKLFTKGKNNLARSDIKSLSYGFGLREVGKDPVSGKPIEAPHIVWFNHVDVSATEAMQAASENKSPGAKDAARQFLLDYLADGPMLQTDVMEAAEANLIAERTLRRAKNDLKRVIAKKDGPKGEWRWHLTEET